MTRASKKEREEFVAVLTRNCPQVGAIHVAQIAGRLMRHGATYGRLQEDFCNGHPIQSVYGADNATVARLQDKWDKRIERETERLEKLITAAAAELGLVPDFQGDPRGYTVKLTMPDRTSNSFSGEGFGIPTS
jgi:hypothetical protein